MARLQGFAAVQVGQEWRKQNKKHLEAKLVPFLGTALLICTMLLIFLALPFSLREAYLSATALDGDDAMTMVRIARVREQLPKAGIDDPAVIDALATRESLDRGRTVLQAKCTQCHDLRTALAQPRTLDSWKQTVARMANRSTILNPISEQDQLEVTAYLIAISPTLQKTLVARRKQAIQAAQSPQAGLTMAKRMQSELATDYDEEKAEAVFEQRCSQCHGLEQVENVTLASEQEAIALVQRMIGNGLVVTEDELMQVVHYLADYYVEEDTTMPSANNSGSTSAASGLNGESLFAQYGCTGCHGVAGSNPIADNYPKVAGLGRGYIINQVTDIRDGRRINGLTTMMQSSISGIKDDEITAIADYLTVQP